MNHQTWSRRKLWAVMVGVFLAGFMVVPMSGAEMQVEEPEPRTVTKTQVREVKVVDTEKLGRLDALDQEIFALSGEVIDAQTKALEAAGALLGRYPYISAADFEAGTDIVNEQTARIKAANARMGELQSQRVELVN